MEDITTSIDGQVITFPNDIFNSSRLPTMYISSDSAAAVTADTPISLEEMGMTYVSIPIQIVSDYSLQQPMLEAVYADGVTNQAIFIDPSQLANLSNGQLVLTEDGLLASISGTNSIIDKDSLLTASTQQALVDDTARPLNLNELDLSCLGNEDSANILDPKIIGTDAEPVPIIDNVVVSPLQEELNNTAVPEEVSGEDVLPPIREGPQRCNVCMKEFKTWVQLKKHKGLHLDDKPYRCPVCPSSFNIPSNLTLHSALHNLESLECPECKKKFSRVASLKAHILLHEQEESLFCIECGDEFSNQIQLDRHMKLHDEEWVKPDPQMKVYQCGQCDRQYSKASVLKEHMKDHFKIKESVYARNYQRMTKRGGFINRCETCNKAFQKPSQLIRHKRIHTGEKPFKCEICTSAFSQKGSLLIHMSSTHKGIRPYQCEFCNATFSQKGNLRAHVVRLHSVPHSQEVVYRCSDCSCVFRKLGSLNAHTNRMHHSIPKLQVRGDSKNSEPAKDTEKTNSSSICRDTSDKENDGNENLNSDQVMQTFITVANKLEDGTICRTTIKQRRMGTVKWHQCNHCSKEFKKPSDLVRHVRIHTREKPYKCKHCFRAFAVRSTLVTHIRTHTGAKNYTCKICSKVYATSSSLKIHTQTHYKKKKATADADTVNKHDNSVVNNLESHDDKNTKIVRGDHIQLEEPILITDNGVIQVVAVKTVHSPDDSADRPHRCMICSTSFRKSNHLKVHLRKHTGEKPFKCHICNRSFISNGVLKGHMRTHLNIKAHKCEKCDKYFSTKGSLRRHSELHSFGHPYVCPYCDRRYKTKSSCRKHERSHKFLQVVSEDGKTIEFHHMLMEEPVFDSEVEVGNINQSHDSNISVEALIVNNLDVTSEPYILHTGENDGNILPEHSALHADASGTITLPSLTGQDQLTQESIREIEETLNQQLFALEDDKEESVLFDQGFDNCDFSAITLQNDQLELNQALSQTALPCDLPQEKECESLFRCEKCDSAFKTSEELATHKLIHVPPNSRTCNICEKTFISAASYKLHAIHHNKEKENACKVCGTSFATEFLLNKHMASHAKEKSHTCPICGSGYRTAAQLRKHSKEHKAPKVRIAKRRKDVRQLTEEETKQLANQLPHHGTTVSEKVLIASFAERDRISELKDPGEKFEHEPLHSNQCKYCPKSFRKPSDLVRHLRTHTGERPYQCDFCNKCFTVKSTLDCHIKTHTSQKQCTCHVCGSMFTTKGSLKVHMRLHTGSRPFRCPVCDQRFRTSGHRKAHLLTHIREASYREQYIVTESIIPREETVCEDQGNVQESAPELPSESENPVELEPAVNFFVCSVCTKIFYKNSALTRHMRVHTGEKPFGCKMCPKTFSQKSTLQIHLKHHTGEKPWKCPVCLICFTQKGNLKTHMRRSHQFTQQAKLKVDIQPKPEASYTIDIGDKTLVDLEKVVSDLFPQMKSSLVKQSQINLGDAEI